jgi:hypothetical protein
MAQTPRVSTTHSTALREQAGRDAEVVPAVDHRGRRMRMTMMTAVMTAALVARAAH